MAELHGREVKWQKWQKNELNFVDFRVSLICALFGSWPAAK